MVKLHDFDGEQLSVTSISKRYLAYSATVIKQALSEGCKSLADLQARDRRCIAAVRRAQVEAAKRLAPSVVTARPGVDRPKDNSFLRDLSSMGLRS